MVWIRWLVIHFQRTALDRVLLKLLSKLITIINLAYCIIIIRARESLILPQWVHANLLQKDSITHMMRDLCFLRISSLRYWLSTITCPRCILRVSQSVTRQSISWQLLSQVFWTIKKKCQPSSRTSRGTLLRTKSRIVSLLIPQSWMSIPRLPKEHCQEPKSAIRLTRRAILW